MQDPETDLLLCKKASRMMMLEDVKRGMRNMQQKIQRTINAS